MLNVLIQTYQSWSAKHRISATLDSNQIWTWSITSTLFQDFGEAIVASPARYLWVQTALLATLSVCLFMGIEGWSRYADLQRDPLTKSSRFTPTGPSPCSLLLPQPDSSHQLHPESLLPFVIEASRSISKIDDPFELSALPGRIVLCMSCRSTKRCGNSVVDQSHLISAITSLLATVHLRIK
jgi:hypothetical protein